MHEMLYDQVCESKIVYRRGLVVRFLNNSDMSVWQVNKRKPWYIKTFVALFMA